MMALNWEDTFKVLREKSTMAGLVGLGVAIAAAFGHKVDSGQEAAITELVLAIISVIAIATRPREPSRYSKPDTWHDRRGDDVRDDRGGPGLDSEFIGVGDIREQETDPSKATGERN